MKTLFERVTIIGLGLLGGSLALALRERNLVKEIVGVARRHETWELALAEGVIDKGGTDPTVGVTGSDLVILASPVEAMPAIVAGAKEGFSQGSLLTDVGSVKELLVQKLPQLLPPGVEFLGSHPMAGSHLQGLANSKSNLFESATCVLTPVAGTSTGALERLRSLWEGVGMQVIERSPEVHDAEVAWVSHGPHAVAFAFAKALGEAAPSALQLRGSGFRDFIRIARSDGRLWSGILSENALPTRQVVEKVIKRLDEFLDVLDGKNKEELSRWIDEGRKEVETGE